MRQERLTLQAIEGKLIIPQQRIRTMYLIYSMYLYQLSTSINKHCTELRTFVNIKTAVEYF